MIYPIRVLVRGASSITPLYNALPQCLKAIEKACTFKNQLKPHLIEKCQYLTNELLTDCTR